MKRQPSELTIIIIGKYTHEPPVTEFEAKIQPIEKAAFHLQTFFNFIGTSARYHEGTAFAADPDFGTFCNDLITLSEIGFAMNQAILKSASELYDFQLKHDTDNSENPTAAFIAERISYLINCDAVPKPIRDALQEAMTEFQNFHIDQTEINDEVISSEFIERVLKSSKYFTDTGEQTGD